VTERKTSPGWGGRREGAGAKPMSPAERQAASTRRLEAKIAESSDLERRIVDVAGLSPRRRLLNGEPVEERTEGPWFARLVAATCVQTIGRFRGQPLVFEPWQVRFIDRALAFDDDGEYLFSTCVLGVPRKNGKTTGTSAVATVKASPADGEGRPEVILAAGSREQAAPLSEAIEAFITQAPLWREIFVVTKAAIECAANDGKIHRIAGDGKLNHGKNPYFTAADELWAWVTPKQVENWNAIATADGAREDAQLWVLSTAGFDLTKPLGILYRAAMAHPARTPDLSMGDGGFVLEDISGRMLMHWYGIGPNTRMDDVSSWKRANPASWRTPERIRRDLAKQGVDESAKRRLYGNAWTSTKTAWIDTRSWADLEDAAAVDEAFRDGATVALAVDASLNHDTTAVAMAAPTSDGRVALRVWVFSTRSDVASHVYFAGDRISLDTVERFIAGGLLHGADDQERYGWPNVARDTTGDVAHGKEELAARYAVHVLGFDPRYFNRSAELLEEAGMDVAAYEPQGRETWDAVQGFYNLIGGGGLCHDGDPVLAAHVAAAAGDKTDRGWKVGKLDRSRNPRPIDGLIAGLIAVDLAVEGFDDRTIDPWEETSEWDED